MTLLERFETKYTPEPNSGCWIWDAAIDRKGYGRFQLNGRNAKASRVSYEMFVGPIPDGLTLDHLCRVRCCVNPLHLEPVTNRENIRRGNTGQHNAVKTHCPQGHPYSGDNLVVHKNGWRKCRACKAQQKKRHKQRRILEGAENVLVFAYLG